VRARVPNRDQLKQTVLDGTRGVGRELDGAGIVVTTISAHRDPVHGSGLRRDMSRATLAES